MRIERLENGKYEAITSVNGYGLRLEKWGNIQTEIVGYGDTHFEAIKRCLQKVDDFIHYKPQFNDEVEREDYKDVQF